MMAACFVRRQIPYRNVFKTPFRNGYIVLLPDGASESPSQVFRSSDLPDMKSLTNEECFSIIGKHTLEFETNLWKLEEKLKDQSLYETLNIFEDVFDPLEKLTAPVDNAWGLMKAIYLANSDALSENIYVAVHDKAKGTRSLKFNSKSIFSVCQNQDIKPLPEEKKRVVNKYLLEGQLNGLALSEGDKPKLKTVLHKINSEKAMFRKKVQISTTIFKHTFMDSTIVRDFPESLLKEMASDRSNFSLGPWTVTLKPDVYTQFMEYCPIRDLRWNVWQAHVRRSSNEGERSLETSTHIEELRSLRKDQAKLLGFSNFADMSMKTKMASSVENVHKMLQRLLRKAYPAQEKEVQELQEFAAVRGFEGTLEMWDVPYWKRKQLRTLYNFEEEKLKEYFPFPHVLQQMFLLCKQLFGLEIIEESNTNVWHPDVRFYNIFDVGSTQPIASFYLDPYARTGKKKSMLNNEGWMVPIRNKNAICNHKPLAALIFNFVPPSEKCASLLTFREVQELFQKFGHALPHLLTTMSYADVSGLSNVEWDAVGVCSNFMSHWLFHSETMQGLSCHYKTGESLPNALLNSLEQLPQLMAGYELCQQLYLSALDLELHTSKRFWLDIMRELWPNYFVFSLDKRNAHPCSFSPIFSGDWAAAYYCHLWSQIVAADVFNAFQECGLDNTKELAKVGERMRSTFLSLGGGCHPSEIFRRFRGRDPSPNALLWSLGLKQTPTAPADVAVEA